MTPTNAFLAWLQTYAATTGYSVSRGMWVESSTTSDKKYVAIWAQSGRAPVAGFVQYPQIRLIVSGTHGGRAKGETPAIEQYAHDIIEAALENSCTDDIANVVPMGGIQGPYYTAADRPFYELNFELIT